MIDEKTFDMLLMEQRLKYKALEINLLSEKICHGEHKKSEDISYIKYVLIAIFYCLSILSIVTVTPALFFIAFFIGMISLSIAYSDFKQTLIY